MGSSSGLMARAPPKSMTLSPLITEALNNRSEFSPQPLTENKNHNSDTRKDIEEDGGCIEDSNELSCADFEKETGSNTNDITSSSSSSSSSDEKCASDSACSPTASFSDTNTSVKIAAKSKGMVFLMISVLVCASCGLIFPHHTAETPHPDHHIAERLLMLMADQPSFDTLLTINLTAQALENPQVLMKLVLACIKFLNAEVSDKISSGIDYAINHYHGSNDTNPFSSLKLPVFMIPIVTVMIPLVFLKLGKKPPSGATVAFLVALLASQIPAVNPELLSSNSTQRNHSICPVSENPPPKPVDQRFSRGEEKEKEEEDNMCTAPSSYHAPNHSDAPPLCVRSGEKLQSEVTVALLVTLLATQLSMSSPELLNTNSTSRLNHSICLVGEEPPPKLVDKCFSPRKEEAKKEITALSLYHVPSHDDVPPPRVETKDFAWWFKSPQGQQDKLVCLTVIAKPGLPVGVENGSIVVALCFLMVFVGPGSPVLLLLLINMSPFMTKGVDLFNRAAWGRVGVPALRWLRVFVMERAKCGSDVVLNGVMQGFSTFLYYTSSPSSRFLKPMLFSAALCMVMGLPSLLFFLRPYLLPSLPLSLLPSLPLPSLPLSLLPFLPLHLLPSLPSPLLLLSLLPTALPSLLSSVSTHILTTFLLPLLLETTDAWGYTDTCVHLAETFFRSTAHLLTRITRGAAHLISNVMHIAIPHAGVFLRTHYKLLGKMTLAALCIHSAHEVAPLLVESVLVTSLIALSGTAVYLTLHRSHPRLLAAQGIPGQKPPDEGEEGEPLNVFFQPSFSPKPLRSLECHPPGFLVLPDNPVVARDEGSVTTGPFIGTALLRQQRRETVFPEHEVLNRIARAEREVTDRWPEGISNSRDRSSDCYSLSVLVEASTHQPGTYVEWPLCRELVC